jgi:pantetheine-phosphate adenylyltransferase
MRVISGSAKGRRLQTTAGRRVRPTSDKVKEALFNILGSRVSLQGARVLDLFAGSGALGIEALSRGAAHVTFVEPAVGALRALRRNLEVCGFTARATLVACTVHQGLQRLQREGARFDGVLADPPYERGMVQRTLDDVTALGLLRGDAWVVVEHHAGEAPRGEHGNLHLTHVRHYGKTTLALFEVQEAMAKKKEAAGQMRRAVYAGSFDPITYGHIDVIRRAVNVFDEVVVAVAMKTSDPNKDTALFSAADRVEMIRESLKDDEGRIVADSFSGLLVDYCEKVDARVSIRGLRAVSDFEYEFQMAMMNRHLKPRIETVFMAASEAHFYTSSRLVKEVARLGGDVRGLVPDPVYSRLMEKIGRRLKPDSRQRWRAARRRHPTIAVRAFAGQASSRSHTSTSLRSCVSSGLLA